MTPRPLPDSLTKLLEPPAWSRFHPDWPARRARTIAALDRSYPGALDELTHNFPNALREELLEGLAACMD
jgi:hypothetical protein